MLDVSESFGYAWYMQSAKHMDGGRANVNFTVFLPPPYSTYKW